MDNLNLNLNKSSDDVLREAAEFFGDQGYSILNAGFAEIVSNPKLFAAYREALCEGVSADNAAVMDQLMNNAGQTILTEAVSGIAPLTSLSMPVIRKLWPRVAMKDAIKTVVATSPIFSISYMKPYMYRITDAGEERIELPRGAFANFGVAQDLNLLDVAKTVQVSVNGGFTRVYFLADTEAANKAAAAKTPLDGNFEIESLTEGTVANDVFTAGSSVRIADKMGLSENVISTAKVGNNEYTVIAKVNLKGAYADVAVMGAAGTVQVKLNAHKSSEWNEESWDIGFDVERQDVRIGTGEHIQAPLTVERLQDLQALYNIDATAEVTDLMTNYFAQKLDRELIDFMIKCYLNRPVNKAFPTGDGYKSAAEHTYEFNVAPAAGYAGSPKAWREELKPVIDYAATAIMQETYFTSGTFVICGNPQDTALLTNIDWQYKGGTSGNVDGVAVTYNIGVFQGAYTYRVISSVNIKQGKLIMTFIPAGEKQLTQAYYPYTFTMEKGAGYRSANHQFVPSIMMTKRHTMFEFTPSVAMIVITNNNGTGQFNKGDLFRNQFEAAPVSEPEDVYTDKAGKKYNN